MLSRAVEGGVLQQIRLRAGRARGHGDPAGARGAALVAEGLSASEIASRLFIQPSTVKSHLHNLYGKLGVSERAAAVAEGHAARAARVGPRRPGRPGPRRPRSWDRPAAPPRVVVRRRSAKLACHIAGGRGKGRPSCRGGGARQASTVSGIRSGGSSGSGPPSPPPRSISQVENGPTATPRPSAAATTRSRRFGPPTSRTPRKR